MQYISFRGRLRYGHFCLFPLLWTLRWEPVKNCLSLLLSHGSCKPMPCWQPVPGFQQRCPLGSRNIIHGTGLDHKLLPQRHQWPGAGQREGAKMVPTVLPVSAENYIWLIDVCLIRSYLYIQTRGKALSLKSPSTSGGQGKHEEAGHVWQLVEFIKEN